MFTSDMKLRAIILEKTYRKVTDFYNVDSLIKGLKLKTLNNADNLIENYIDNERIQKLLAFQMLYIGIDPKRLSILNYSYGRNDVWCSLY